MSLKEKIINVQNVLVDNLTNKGITGLEKTTTNTNGEISVNGTTLLSMANSVNSIKNDGISINDSDIYLKNGILNLDGTTVEISEDSHDWTELFKDKTNAIYANINPKTEVSSVKGMFNGCSKLNFIKADFSKLPNISGLYKNCTGLTDFPSLDYTKATDITYLCEGCSNLKNFPTTHGILNNTFDSATSVKGMFKDCTSLTNIIPFDTSHVTDFSEMFKGCTALTSVTTSYDCQASDGCWDPMTGWHYDKSKATNLDSMYEGCTSLTDAAVAKFDMGQAFTMNATFKNCTSFEMLANSIGSNVTSCNELFSGCSKLTNAGTIDMANVTSATDMFKGCTKLTSAQLKNVKVNLDLSTTSLDHLSLMCIIDNYAGTGNQITLNDELRGELSDSEKTTASGKKIEFI